MLKKATLITSMLFITTILFSQNNIGNEIKYDSTKNYVDIKDIHILKGQTLSFKYECLKQKFYTNITRSKENINYNRKNNKMIMYFPDNNGMFTEYIYVFDTSFIILDIDKDVSGNKYLKMKNELNGSIVYYRYPDKDYLEKNNLVVPFTISGYKEKQKHELYKKRKYILDTLDIKKYINYNVEFGDLIYNKYIELDCISYNLNRKELTLKKDNVSFIIAKDDAISLNLKSINEIEEIKKKNIKYRQIKDKLNKFCDKIKIGSYLYASGTYYDRINYTINGNSKFVDINTKFKLVDVDIKGTYYYYFVFTLEDNDGVLYKKEFQESDFYKNFSTYDLKKTFKSISESIWKLINNGEVRIGMSDIECELSWGFPIEVNTTKISGLTHEQYVYHRGYLYFDNGKLVAIQE